jgi:putative endonuclease
MMRPGPEDARALGQRVEDVARAYLEGRGLKVLDHNFRTRFGELDLVLEHGPALVFAEVRYRGRTDFGGAAASVDPRKQAKLRAAAEIYLGARPEARRRPCRFDVVAVTSGASGLDIDWIQDAF